jgi:hypothetical protein
VELPDSSISHKGGLVSLLLCLGWDPGEGRLALIRRIRRVGRIRQGGDRRRTMIRRNGRCQGGRSGTQRGTSVRWNPWLGVPDPQEAVLDSSRSQVYWLGLDRRRKRINRRRSRQGGLPHEAEMRMRSGQFPCRFRSNNVFPAVLAICCRVPAGGPRSGGSGGALDQLGLAQVQNNPAHWPGTTRGNP